MRNRYDELFTDVPSNLMTSSNDGTLRVMLPEHVSLGAQIIYIDSRIIAVGSSEYPAFLVDVDRPCGSSFNSAPGLFSLRVKMIAEQRVFAEIIDDSLLLWLPHSHQPILVQQLVDQDELVFLRKVVLRCR